MRRWAKSDIFWARRVRLKVFSLHWLELVCPHCSCPMSRNIWPRWVCRFGRICRDLPCILTAAFSLAIHSVGNLQGTHLGYIQHREVKNRNQRRERESEREQERERGRCLLSFPSSVQSKLFNQERERERERLTEWAQQFSTRPGNAPSGARLGGGRHFDKHPCQRLKGSWVRVADG